MKSLFIALLLIATVTVCFILMTRSLFINEKEKIVNQIFAYKDSAGIAKAALILHDSENNKKYADGIKINISQDLEKRMQIKKRIWHFQWKIDSLNIRLKEY